MVNRKIPKIRFRHFSDDWKSDKLGKLGTVAMNKRIFKEETSEVGEIPFYKIGSFGREPDSFITREKFEEYKSKYPYPEIGDILISASGSIGRTVEYLGEEAYFQDSNIVWLKHDERLDNYLIKKGEFAYNKSYSTGYPLGAIKRLDKYENGVLSTLYILFKAVDVDSDYLAHYYESDKWHREVSMCAAEGARNHGLLNIAPADFFNTRLVIPKELEEQRAIGTYFINLDNLINSHQEKISQLETLKKKLLQDMFI